MKKEEIKKYVQDNIPGAEVEEVSYLKVDIYTDKSPPFRKDIYEKQLQIMDKFPEVLFDFEIHYVQ